MQKEVVFLFVPKSQFWRLGGKRPLTLGLVKIPSCMYMAQTIILAAIALPKCLIAHLLLPRICPVSSRSRAQVQSVLHRYHPNAQGSDRQPNLLTDSVVNPHTAEITERVRQRYD